MFRVIQSHKRKVAAALLFFFISSLISPAEVLALSSGPSQPEFQQFQQASSSEMVDPFTGDFSYNIPLFELPGPNGGYPFNLAYQAGITPEQEASWVGLGWSLNAGAITRQMRGLPDDFDGDEIVTTRYMDTNYTYGVNPGVNFEILGADGEKLNINAALGYTILYNSYNGFNYSIDGNIGAPLALGSNSNKSLQVNSGFSLGTAEGLNLNQGIGFNVEQENENKERSITGASLNSGFSSRYGVTGFALGLSHTQEMSYNDGKEIKETSYSNNFSHAISLSSKAFTPAIAHPLKNDFVSGLIKVGTGANGIFGSAKVRAFYSTQNFRENVSSVRAFGYMNLQNAGDEDLMDFNRERDGVIREELPNLPVPVLTHDIYTIKGQGVGGMFKPVRNDFGIVHDNRVKSVSNSYSADFDLGPAGHFAGGTVYTGGKSVSGAWNLDDQGNVPAFKDFELNELDEPYYFQVRGEHSSIPSADYDAIGGDKPIDLHFQGVKDPSLFYSINANPQKSQRTIRNNSVVAVTNADLLKAGITNDPVLNLFKISSGIDRSEDKYKPNHVAGYITTDKNGMRYVYALPVYNNESEEVVFSTSHTDPDLNIPDELLKHSEMDAFKNNKLTMGESEKLYYSSDKMPAYAHSYLLTAVVGPDYVDVDNNGVSQNDIGYWINFRYSKLPYDYIWKSPYQGAAFLEGQKYKVEDNKGSYQVGSKELWYLDVAETKTHYAVFNKSERNDNKEAIHPLALVNKNGGPTDINDAIANRQSTLKLDNVQLFAKNQESPGISGGTQLMKVTLDNDHYDLCTNLPYGDAGKLTLKGVHFEYGKSSKQLNKYRFEYANNEDYNPYRMDRWGYYKSDDILVIEGGTASNISKRAFPYVNQRSSGNDERNTDAAAWSLQKIHLPSGSTISVDYEMDDYAYVQNKPAMKMVKLTEASLDGQYLKFSRFNGATYLDYFKALKGQDIYFKALVTLKDGDQDYISGYVTPETADSNGIKLKGSRNPIKELSYQHIRTGAADLLNPNKPNHSPSVRDAARILVALSQELQILFKGFTNYADDQNWADELATDQSWIRLPVLTGVKYGGGHRVKRVVITEDENVGENEKPTVYGQVYDYTIEEDGRTISSGVAANEPIIGGDENPLRTAKKYSENLRLHSHNNLFFEYPINEGSHPGASVGYSKVTVMSLATATRYGSDAEYADNFKGNDHANTGYKHGTTGKTEYLFFTARDFPTITYETTKKDDWDKKFRLIPLIGLSSFSYYVGVQGYSIVNNDMHGKLYKTSQYRLSENDQFEPEPYAYTSYQYRTAPAIVDDQEVLQTVNNFYVSSDDNNILVADPTGGSTKRKLGVEYEVVMDTRNYYDEVKNYGANANLDAIFTPIPIPAPTIWPTIAKDIVDSKTAVTNKVVFKSGILESVTKMQDGAEVTTSYYGWDKVTGRPVLSKTITEFDDKPTFSMVTPAYHIYDRMGGSYSNIGLQYRVSSLQKIEGKNEYEFHTQRSLITAVAPVLVPGDEIILQKLISNGDDEPASYATVASAIYLGTYSGTPRFHCNTVLETGVDIEYKATIFRSGNRNHLMVDAGNITSLKDPSGSDGSKTYTKTIPIPNN